MFEVPHRRFELLESKIFKADFSNLERKFAEIDGDFFALNAMRNNEWKGTNLQNRSSLVLPHMGLTIDVAGN